MGGGGGSIAAGGQEPIGQYFISAHRLMRKRTKLSEADRILCEIMSGLNPKNEKKSSVEKEETRTG